MPSPSSAGQRLPKYLTQSEVEALFRVITDHRDQAIFAVMYQYGLRVGELALLERGDVDLARSRILIKRLKGGAWSERPLFRATAELLSEHLSQDVQPHGPLFPGRNGPLRKRAIQYLFARYRAQAGISPRHGCHSLRHSIATHLLDAGMSLEFVQDHLGHQSIRSTSIYARITNRHREAIFQRLEVSPWIVQLPPLSRPLAPAA